MAQDGVLPVISTTVAQTGVVSAVAVSQHTEQLNGSNECLAVSARVYTRTYIDAYSLMRA